MKYLKPLSLFAALACASVSSHAAPDWTYDADSTGQEDWGSIPGYEICETGTNQSPITISYTKEQVMAPLNFKYTPGTATLSTDSKSFIARITNGGSVSELDKTYHLRRIELHSPSEHMIRSDFWPVEFHLVHESDDGHLFIVAIFGDLGAEHVGLAKLLSQVPNPAPKEFISGEFTFDASLLLPKTQGYYSYKGSLTSPPCTENVEWRVLKRPILILPSQLTKLGRIVGRNARLMQPVYMREVTETIE